MSVSSVPPGLQERRARTGLHSHCPYGTIPVQSFGETGCIEK